MPKHGPPPHAYVRPCRKCRADIFFVTSINGKPMPLDAAPVQVVELEDRPPGSDGIAEHHYVGHVRTAYISHHATCPNAEEFRRSRNAPSDG